MAKPKAHKTLVGRYASWRDLVLANFETTTTADSFVVFYAPFDLKIRAASYSQEDDCAGTNVTGKLRNETTSTDLTATLDLDALGAMAGGNFVVNDVLVNAGDVVSFVTAGTITTAPGSVGLMLDIERLDY